MSLNVDTIFDISGKVIVLTGACGTIGRTLLDALVQRQAKLALVDLAIDPLNELADLFQGSFPVAADVTNPSEVQRVLNETLRTFGRVDVLINNHQCTPGESWDACPEEFPHDLWQRIINVNLTGTFLMCRDFGRQMLLQGKGSIINLASTYGVVSSNPDLYTDNSFSNPVAYSASKGGVVMLTKYLGTHWAERGVRVNCLSPHGILGRSDKDFITRFSKMSPMGRPMAPEEIVGPVVFLASDASSYATGTNLLVEGGWTAW